MSDLSLLTHTQTRLLLRLRANNNNINSAAALLVGLWIITLDVDLDWSSLLLPFAVCGLFGDNITFRYLPILTGKEILELQLSNKTRMFKYLYDPDL